MFCASVLALETSCRTQRNASRIGIGIHQMLRRYRLLEIETVMRGIVNGAVAANRRFGSSPCEQRRILLN
jgi:hypothetical protein